jgi:AcrR family transcriptional regulator
MRLSTSNRQTEGFAEHGRTTVDYPGVVPPRWGRSGAARWFFDFGSWAKCGRSRRASRDKRKAFFATFKSKERYVDALATSLIHASLRSSHDMEEMIRANIVSSRGDIRRTVRTVCNWDFQQVKHDSATRAQIAILVLAHGHRGAMAGLKGAYSIYDSTSIRAYNAVLARWGATFRAPFSAQLVGVTLTAIVEGLALRSMADPNAVPDDLLGNVVIALLSSIADTADSHEHADDVIAPLADDVMRLYQAAQPDGLPADPRKAIIESARSQFGERGYYLTTLERIAATAAVPQAVLRSLFPNKVSIIVGALEPAVKEMAQQIHDDALLGLNERDMVLRHLGRLVSFASRHIEYVEALLMVVAHDTRTSPESAILIKKELDLPAILTSTIEAGQKRGVFAASASAYDLAALVTNALLLRFFTRRNDDPASHVQLIARTFLDGLVVSARSPNAV